MGFTCGIYKYKKMSFGSVANPENYKLHNTLEMMVKGYPVEDKYKVNITQELLDEAKSKMVADEYGERHLYEEVQSWCSSGGYWFDALKDKFIPLNLSHEWEDVYVFNKDNIQELADYALSILNKFNLGLYNPTHSIRTEVDDEGTETGDYTLRVIDGMELENDEGAILRIWKNEDGGYPTSTRYMDYDELYAYQSFIRSILHLFSVDWDNEEVVISGGW